MEEKKTEGILLQAIPYLGNQKILKVFTEKEGLISLMAKKKSLLPLTNPFLVAEWVYKKGKKEIHSLLDASLRSDFPDLKSSFATITAAGQLARDILHSQMAEKPSQAPYALTLAYLQKLPSFSSPEVLIASFRLKLLMHDGFLALQQECASCGNRALNLSGGESLCQTHVMEGGLPFSSIEWDILHRLTYGRQFRELQELRVDASLNEKIRRLFYENKER